LKKKYMSRNARLKRAMTPLSKKRKPKGIKPRRVRIRKTTFLKALVGTFGNRAVIAQRLDIARGTVVTILKREGWEEVAAKYEEEVERVIDVAENTMMDVMLQRLDLGQARQAAAYILDRKAPGYKPHSTVALEGGDKPIQIQSAVVHIPVEALRSPADVKRAILDTMDIEEEEQQAP